MVWRKKFIGMKAVFTFRSHLHHTSRTKRKNENLLRHFSEIGDLVRLQPKLRSVCDKGDTSVSHRIIPKTDVGGDNCVARVLRSPSDVGGRLEKPPLQTDLRNSPLPKTLTEAAIYLQ